MIILRTSYFRFQDIDHKMVEIAKANSIEAGLGELVNWRQMQVADWNPKQDNGYIDLESAIWGKIGRSP